jgi:NADH-quinone oxidoreductase subunit E
MPPVDLNVVDGIIEGHLGRPGAVIAILQAIQEEYRYLPREVFPRISSSLSISEAKIFSVATFYENFSLEPKGRIIIKVCDGTACHVRRSPPILARLRQDLGLTEGKVTTADLSFTVETVACLGACGLAPVLTVNDKAYPAMTPDKATALIESMRSGGAAKPSLAEAAALAAASVINPAEAAERQGGGHA